MNVDTTQVDLHTIAMLWCNFIRFFFLKNSKIIVSERIIAITLRYAMLTVVGNWLNVVGVGDCHIVQTEKKSDSVNDNTC